VTDLSTRSQESTRIEHYAWVALVACIALVPLAVTKVPFSVAPLTFDAFAFPQTVVLAIGVSVALALWGAACWTRQTEVYVSKSMIPFALFAAWAAVATVVAYEPVRSLLGRSLSTLSLMQILAYSALFFLVIQLVDSRERMRAVTWTVVVSSSVVGLIALFQQLFHANVFGLTTIEDWVTGRGSSTLGNPDHLGTFLVLPFLLSALLFLFEEDGKGRVAAGICVAVLGTALTGTLTRGAWIAAIAGVLIAVALLVRARLAPAQGKRALVLLGICVAAVAIALAASDFADLASRFRTAPVGAPAPATTLAGVNAASSDRINVWRAALLVVADRPLTGTGPAAFELGWYPNAIDPSSGGGAGGIADDPHSLPIYILATTGIPGLLTYLAACAAALLFGAKTSIALVKKGAPSGKATYYVAWFVAACALQIALLVGAVSAPIVMFAFVSLAMLLRPTAHAMATEKTDSLSQPVFAGVSAALAIALVVAVYPSLSAEVALVGALRSNLLEQARAVAQSVPWNVDVQKAYYHFQIEQVNRALAAGTDTARSDALAVVVDLEGAGVADPREYYYPSVRAQILTETSSRLRDTELAEAALTAADDALAIMPASIPTRVHRAVSLSNLQRFGDMAVTLEDYWENETLSAYPGTLYAQALSLSGDTERAEEIFGQLIQRFPDQVDAINAAKQQVAEPQ